jgi:hypothetical protein
VSTDVSEENIASIFRFEKNKLSKKPASKEVASRNRSVIFWDVTSCSLVDDCDSLYLLVGFVRHNPATTHGVTSHKTVMFIGRAVKASILTD